MGETTKTATSTSGPSNPDVNATVSKLAKGLGAEYAPGKSLYQAPSATTQAGWGGALAAAGNTDFSSAISNAMGNYGRIASGAEIGQNDPGFAALRAKLENDVTASTNSAFNNSGLFGSDSNVKGLAEGLTNGLGALDYKQYSDSLARRDSATAMLPQLFTAGQLPSSIQQSIGASMDADAAAKAGGPTDYLAKLSAILNGTAASGGTTTTQTQPGTPLWQTLLGLGISAL